MLLPYLLQAATQDPRPLFVQSDLIVLAVHFISVIYIVFRAVKSLEGQVVIRFKQDELHKQLVAQELRDFIGIGFALPGKGVCPIEALTVLPIVITNQLAENSIFIDWDRSSFTNINSRAQRVIRLLPSRTLDLLNAQVPSVITPQRTLQEVVTAESSLSRPSDSNVLDVSGPLLDITTFQKKANATHEFSLRLSIRVATTADPAPSHRRYILPCEFSLRKLTWQDVVPWSI